MAEKYVLELSDVLDKEIIDYGRCPKTTVLIESLGSQARASERVHSASKLGRRARWHQAICGKLLEDYDIKQAVIEAADHIDAPAVSKSMFEPPSNAVFSLGPTYLEDFMSEKLKFESVAPSREVDSVILLDSLLECGGNLAMMRTAWFSWLGNRRMLLARQPTVPHAGDHVCGIFLHVTDYGIVYVPVKLKVMSNNAGHYVVFGDVEAEYKMVVVTQANHVLFRVCELVSLPPSMGHVEFERSGDKRPAGVVAMVGVLKPLLDVAATQAFPNMSLTRLKQLERTLMIVPWLEFCFAD